MKMQAIFSGVERESPTTTQPQRLSGRKAIIARREKPPRNGKHLYGPGDPLIVFVTVSGALSLKTKG
jgi:hypothetical protein